MDKEFLEWWEVNRFAFFEDDATGIREIAAAAWKAGQDALDRTDGVGELVQAAEKVYQLRDAMHANGPSALIIALAMIDLQKAADKVQQGMASKPPDVGY